MAEFDSDSDDDDLSMRPFSSRAQSIATGNTEALVIENREEGNNLREEEDDLSFHPFRAIAAATAPVVQNVPTQPLDPQGTLMPPGGTGGERAFTPPPHKRLWFCYLLRTRAPQHPLSTYIGFTANPFRRLRQHNGELKAGAVRTHRDRPWEFVVIVHGFPDKHSALQFEWHLHHPRESSKFTMAPASLKLGGHGAKAKLLLVRLLLKAPPFCSMALGLRFPRADLAALMSETATVTKKKRKTAGGTTGIASSTYPANNAAAANQTPLALPAHGDLTVPLSIGPLSEWALLEELLTKTSRRRRGAAAGAGGEQEEDENDDGDDEDNDDKDIEGDEDEPGAVTAAAAAAAAEACCICADDLKVCESGAAFKVWVCPSCCSVGHLTCVAEVSLQTECEELEEQSKEQSSLRLADTSVDTSVAAGVAARAAALLHERRTALVPKKGMCDGCGFATAWGNIVLGATTVAPPPPPPLPPLS